MHSFEFHSEMNVDRNCRNYVMIFKKYRDKSNEKNSIEQKKRIFFRTVGFFRKFILTAVSVFFDRFDRIFERVNRTILIQDMTSLKQRNFNVHHFIFLKKRSEDSITEIELNRIRFFIFEFFCFKYIFHELHTYVLPFMHVEKFRKIFFCENIFLSAQFWEICIRLIYVETVVLHNELDDLKKIVFVRRFNDSKNFLLVFIIMHSISFQKINFDICCNKILIVINVINEFQKWQFWERLIRIFFY